MKAKKVFVGLSGGVDSAVSAALLKKEGVDVTGVFITIAIAGYPCPAAADRISAMRVAAHLDIPFLEVDLSAEYEQEVFRPSIEEWRRGFTPNPDTLCNEKIKFGVFFDWCIERGAEYVATGHYALLRKAPSLRRDEHDPYSSAKDFATLYVAADKNKDQTYFLWAVPETKLQKTLFPIGHLQKSEVRALAAKFGLPNAARPDSQGLCFLGDISLDDMLEKELGLKEGDVLNEKGEVVGTHHGALRYTLGQRHGFELSVQSPDSAPHFVIAKDADKNTITVSAGRVQEGNSQTKLTLAHTNWIGRVTEGEYMARYRYRQTLIPATLSLSPTPMVVLKEPQAVPAGQSLVLYDGERCLGGGVVESVTLE